MHANPVNLTELNCFGYLIGGFYVGPCEEEKVQHIFLSQPGGIDQKSVLLLLVTTKQRYENKYEVTLSCRRGCSQHDS